MNLLFIVGGSIALVVGLLAGYLARVILAQRNIQSAEQRAEQLLAEAKNKGKEILLQAKDKSLQVIEDAKKEDNERRKEVAQVQARLEKRESLFDDKLLALEDKEKQVQERIQKIDELKKEILAIKEQQSQRLQTMAGLTQAEAKQELVTRLERDMKEDLFARFQKIERDGDEEMEKKARDLMATAMMRYAGSHAGETTTTVVNIPNEEMKGRIIGREGRNIKVIEQLTGVEVIIDETPGVIVLSGFSLLRRYLAKRVLEELLSDGRIQPARIEETVERVKKELAKEIRKAGEEAAFEVGVAGLPPKIIQLIGMLKFRTSYGQNNLMHSIEVSHLAGMLAEMLGANVAVAKKGGLLHDIGKAIDHEVQGSHPELGYSLMKKFGLPEEIAYMSIGHHEDHPKTLEAVIVKVSDALSGARTGARRGTFEQYVQRLEELENLAKSFPGVDKAYAIQAGREIRVFVQPEQVDDWGAAKMAKDIANKIQEELKYPGEVRVTVIREKRLIEYAR